MLGRINEIFESIQGEGIYVGRRQIFVRFAGCNMKCCFCDTDTKSFSEYEPGYLYDKLKRDYPECNFISFTGGEPLLQKDFLREILSLTYKEHYKNYLETNGTLPEALEEVIDFVDIVAMDLKLPSSTANRAFWKEHRDFLNIAGKREVFLKAIICQSTTEEDLEEAIKLIREIKKDAVLVLQPNSLEKLRRLTVKLDKFCQIAKANNIKASVMPQMHKILGVK